MDSKINAITHDTLERTTRKGKENVVIGNGVLGIRFEHNGVFGGF